MKHLCLQLLTGEVGSLLNNSSPMMEQYARIKDEHRDKILLFQVGDFYELFYEDARIASRDLDLILTTRDSDKENPVPLAGVPMHAVDNYLHRLLEKGYKVAICDQVEDASQVKGLVKREVTRIVTPGTVTDEAMLQETRNNYLISLLKDSDNYYGMAVVDVSTGSFWATEISGENAINLIKAEWQRITPAEAICTSWMREDKVLYECFNLWDQAMVEEVPEEYFFHENALQTIKDQWDSKDIDEFLFGKYPLAVAAGGALIMYLKSLQKSRLDHLQPVELYFPGEYMVLDGITRRNLELTQTMREGKKKGSLLGVMDHTSTSMGGRLLKRWIEQPLKDINHINRRIEAVQELSDNVSLKDDLKSSLKNIFDLERLCSRINYGNVNARDLIALKKTLNLLPQIKSLIPNAQSDHLREISQQLPTFETLITLLESALVEEPPLNLRDGGIIKDGYNEEVDRLRKVCRESKDWLLEMEKQERERTGIKSLKISYNRVYGYYLEVTKNNIHLVPQEYHRKQTLVNAERYITEKLKELEDEITGATEKLVNLEYRIFEEVREEVLAYTSQLQFCAQLLAKLDCLQSLGEVAIINRYSRPHISPENPLHIAQCRHPVIENMNLEERFVPNDAYLDHSQKMLIITGPNMAGKSTYCRSVALVGLLAQIGSFVPANNATLPVFDRIFARVGASDDLSAGQSTFMVEMNETATILKEATPQTLVVLDEIGRGTSTFDGMSIARSVLEYINHHLNSWTLFSTHYHELTALEDELQGIKNCTMAVREKGNSVIFLRKVIPGKADKSYGVNVARLAGLPPEVIERAETILKEAESQSKQQDKNPIKQISFFELGSENQTDDDDNTPKVIEDLKSLQPDLMSPLEALEELYRLQSLLNSEEYKKES